MTGTYQSADGDDDGVVRALNWQVRGSTDDGGPGLAQRTCVVGALGVRGAGALGSVVEELRTSLQHQLQLQQLRVAVRGA